VDAGRRDGHPVPFARAVTARLSQFRSSHCGAGKPDISRLMAGLWSKAVKMGGWGHGNSSPISVVAMAGTIKAETE